MRVAEQKLLTDHDLLSNVTSADHHPPVEKWTLLINALSIAPGTYQKRIAITYSGHQVVKGILRGLATMDITGYEGSYVVGGNAALSSMAINVVPQGGSGYVTSYMGAYSRVHGDSYLSRVGMYGAYIRLQDVYMDGTDVVIEFNNTASGNRSLTAYGSGICK